VGAAAGFAAAVLGLLGTPKEYLETNSDGD
jgi:hypothetical protein